MKHVLTKGLVMLFALTTLAIFLMAERPQAVLGKINFAVLFDAAPAMPASTADAGKKAFGTNIGADALAWDFSALYAPYDKQVAAAHEVIRPAIDSRRQNQDAMANQAIADANNNPIISGMGGIDKMSEMSEQEQQQAAMQAMGDYQRSKAGGHQETANATQAIMQRVMNDPEYRERFEKMTPEQQEAEMRKAMGPSAHVAEHSAAEQQRAMQTPNEMAAAAARQNELGGLLQRILRVDTEFDKKDKDISASPGNHNQIAKETEAKIAKLPIVHIPGEASYDGPDPVGLKKLRREQAVLDHTRAGLELQQRTALYAERRAKYKEMAASYAAWLKQGAVASSNASVNLVSNASANLALECEEELIKLAEKLRKFHEEKTRDAAYSEQNYQKVMTES
jgi:hypothetical protein